MTHLHYCENEACFMHEVILDSEECVWDDGWRPVCPSCEHDVQLDLGAVKKVIECRTENDLIDALLTE
jgi:hypothetical protein